MAPLSAYAFYVLRNYTERREALTDAMASKTLESLGQINKGIERLYDIYGKCRSEFENLPYVPNYKLEPCVDEVRAALVTLDRTRSGAAAVIDRDILSEIDGVFSLFRADYRMLAMTQELTKSFEEDLIRGLYNMCPMKNKDTSNNKPFANVFLKPGNVVGDQTNTYYEIRDFILPKLIYTQTLLTARARAIQGLPITTKMAFEANSIPKLLAEQKAYKPTEYEAPLTIAVGRAMQARNMKVGTTAEGHDPVSDVEKMRVQGFYANVPLVALRGHAGDVKQLIECGLLKPEAINSLP